jgi:hypothetical protein
MREETVDRQTRGRNHETESAPPVGGPAGRDHAPTAREEEEGTGTRASGP